MPQHGQKEGSQKGRKQPSYTWEVSAHVGPEPQGCNIVTTESNVAMYRAGELPKICYQ